MTWQPPRRSSVIDLSQPTCECGKPHDFEAIVKASASAAKCTPKETAVLLMMFKGCEYKEIAVVLGNTIKTIKHHVAAIFHRFGVSSRYELHNVVFPV